MNEDEKLGDGLFTGMVNLWVHQNKLLWNRGQTVFALQAAALVGSWNLFDKPTKMIGQPAEMFAHYIMGGKLLLFCTGVLTFILAALIRRDWQVRDHHKDNLERVAWSLGLKDFKTTPGTSWHTLWLKGDYWLFGITIILGCLDFYFLKVWGG